MLERLADMLRGQDTRGGFEATADMLSITGLTLEQFADLMGGLGYKADRGERAKVKAAPEPPMRGTRGDGRAGDRGRNAAWRCAANGSGRGRHARSDAAGGPGRAAGRSAGPAAGEAPADMRLRGAARDANGSSGDTPPEIEAEAETEIEVFYTFTWAPRAGAAIVRSVVPRAGGRQAPWRAAEGRRRQAPRQGRQGPRWQGRQGPPGRAAHLHRPPEKPAKVDPDNPFAVLAALKDKS
jgi:ATP-dependent RNA helicase SUPV3L1/SUV3